jgi:general secretion pathway protein H
LVKSAAARGFTLVELLVVLLIMSVLLVAAPIAFDRVLPGLQLRSDARGVAGVLREARAQAIRTNREATVTVDVAARTYSRSDAGTSQHFSEGVTVTLKTAESELLEPDVGRIRFFPDGTSTGGMVSLDRGGRTYNIAVDWLYGRVQIVE